MFHLH